MEDSSSDDSFVGQFSSDVSDASRGARSNPLQSPVSSRQPVNPLNASQLRQHRVSFRSGGDEEVVMVNEEDPVLPNSVIGPVGLDEARIERELKRQWDLLDIDDLSPGSRKDSSGRASFLLSKQNDSTRWSGIDGSSSGGGIADADNDAGDVPGSFLGISAANDPHEQEHAARENALRQRVLNQHAKMQKLKERNKDLSLTTQKQKIDIESLKTDLILAEKKVGVGAPLSVAFTNPQQMDLFSRKRHGRREKGNGDVLFDDEGEDGAGKDSWSRQQILMRVRRYKRALLKHLLVFIPLISEVTFMETHYGTGVAKFFSFFRWLVWVFLFLAFVNVPFLILHLVETSIIGNWGSYITPEFLLYSSYGSSEAPYVIVVFSVAIITMVVALMFKYIVEDQDRRSGKLQEQWERQNRFSKLVFNCWDHSVHDRLQIEETRLSIAENIRVLLNEDSIKKAIQNRNAKERADLIVRRVIAAGIIVLLVIAVWVLLFSLTVTQDQIQSATTSTSAISGFIVPCTVAVINAFFPHVVLLITQFEKWDNPTFIMKMQLLRLYALKIASILIYMFTFFQVLSGRSLLSQISPSLVEVGCGENYVGNELMKLLIISFFTDKIFAFIVIWGRRLVFASKTAKSGAGNQGPAVLGAGVSNVRSEFLVSMETISVIFMTAIILGCIPFIPSVAIVGCLFMYINFKFLSWRLRNHMRIPANRTSASDIGVYFMIVFLLTFVISMMSWSYVMAFRSSSTCGPFSGSTYYESMLSSIRSDSASSYIFDIFTQPVLLWSVICVLIVLSATRKHAAKIASLFLLLQQDRFDRHVEHVDAIIRKQARDIQRLRKETEESV
eukprot:ANDGO_01152.mRNA.1 hypothetical protein H310_03798